MGILIFRCYDTNGTVYDNCTYFRFTENNKSNLDMLYPYSTHSMENTEVAVLKINMLVIILSLCNWTKV